MKPINKFSADYSQCELFVWFVAGNWHHGQMAWQNCCSNRSFIGHWESHLEGAGPGRCLCRGISKASWKGSGRFGEWKRKSLKNNLRQRGLENPFQVILTALKGGKIIHRNFQMSWRKLWGRFMLTSAMCRMKIPSAPHSNGLTQLWAVLIFWSIMLAYLGETVHPTGRNKSHSVVPLHKPF